MRCVWRHIGAIYLALALFVSCLAGVAAEAAAAKEYYLILDNQYSYLMSEQLYEEVRRLMDEDDAQSIADLLHQAYGSDKIPEQIHTIVLRVYEYGGAETGGAASGLEPDGGGSGLASEKTEMEDSDFDILAGRLMNYHGNDKAVTIPDGVAHISQGAFYNNNKVEKIVVPSSVKSVADYAFYNCGRLKCIVFAGKSKPLGNKMICKCSKLQNIVAPKNSNAWKYAVREGIRTFASDRPTFGQSQVHLLAGDSEKLVLYNAAGIVKWRSSAKSVVSVSSAGKIKCLKKGKAKITAAAGGRAYRLTVHVSEKSEDKRIEQVIRTTIKKGMSTREKIKAVHDWLIRNVKYDYDGFLRGEVPKISHTSQGALLRGIAVCDGYSKAMKKILNRLGIPCEIVIGKCNGTGHAWNMVKTGGKWLYVDVTFDDPIVNGKNTNTKPYYTYFLKTAKQMRRDHAWGRKAKRTSQISKNEI